MLIGSLLGAISFCITFGDAGMASTLFLMAALFVPMLGATMGIFPLDGVQWSLLFELLANFAHGAALWRVSTRLLAVVALFAFLAFALGSFFHGSVAVGDTSKTFLLGLPRAAFGYVMGMILFRVRELTAVRQMRGMWPMIALLAIILAASAIGGWVTEMLAVLAMPILIVAGASATTRLPTLCEYAGRLSFPVYAIQVPILCFCAHLPTNIRLAVEIALVTVGAALVEFCLRSRGGRAVPPKSEIGAAWAS